LKKINRKMKLLDVGAGEMELKKVLPSNFIYHSLDYGTRSNENIKSEKEHTYLFNLDKGRFPIKDNVYDVVVCLDTLEHVLEPEKVIEEIKRVAKKDAIFYLGMPNEYNFVLRLSHLFGRVTFCDEPFQIVTKHLHIHKPRTKDIVNLFSKHFHLIKVNYFWYHYRLPNMINHCINLIAQIIPSLFSKQVIVKAIKLPEKRSRFNNYRKS